MRILVGAKSMRTVASRDSKISSQGKYRFEHISFGMWIMMVALMN